jgi:hypothetical protein
MALAAMTAMTAAIATRKEERISLGVLPPSIGAPETDAEEEVAPKPCRRAVRKPRPDEDGDEASPTV